jgi:hypothetical protein
MISKYNKNINLPPIILYRENLLELIEILTESPNAESISLEIIITYKNVENTLTTIEELRNYKHEGNLGNIKIVVSFYEGKDTKSHKYISMDLNNISAKYYIATDDEVWFFGKISQIDEFIKKHKRWYSIIRKISPPIFFVYCGFVFGSIQLLSKNMNLYFLLPIFSLLIIQSLLLLLVYVIFPYTTIYLREKNKYLTFESKTILISILSLIIALVSLIINIIK